MSPVPITITINGTPTPAQVEPRTLLVQFLRDELELTGTHVGCDTSQCGACTVSLNGEAVKSCTLFAVQADGMDVQTIEGIGSMDDLHPIQAAFWEMHGLQCGFCTPGMIMASAEIIRRNPNPTEDEIREQLGGNFCRCTGYHNIVKAISSAAATMREKGAEAGQAADD